MKRSFPEGIVSEHDSENVIPPGFYAEFLAAFFLRRLGFFLTMTTELDEEFATDILITGHRRVKDRRPEVAIQLATGRKGRGKAGRFVRRAPKRGRLLYVKAPKRITLEMTRAMRTAIFALWDDPDRAARRAHGIRIFADGRFRWIDIAQPP